MKEKEFLEEAGFPTEREALNDPTIQFGYFSYLLRSADQTPGRRNNLRLVTLSKDFFLNFSRFSDESKARFMNSLAKQARKTQEEDGKIFTLEGESSQVQFLVTLVTLSGECVLHVEKR